jgi:hypothetical protein
MSETTRKCIERPVHNRESGGKLVWKFGEPRIVHSHIDYADLQTVESLRIIHQTQLEAARVFRDIHQTVLKAGKSSLINIHEPALPAGEFLSADIDDAPLNAVINVVVIDKSPTETRAVAGAAVDESEGQPVLGIFAPDVQRQAVDGCRS